MPLIFEVFNAEDGVFANSDHASHGALMAKLYGLLEKHESGQMGDKPYLAALAGLLAGAPDFVDIHMHMANYWHRQGKPKKALDIALQGLGICNALIPEGFNGRIEWGHLDNRPYLRAMHIALLSYMRLRRHKDAATMIEQMLARNPMDNQGVRYLLGSEWLRAGDTGRARAVFEGSDGYPPYFYELGLGHLLHGDWVAAATALRRGFAANPYIAEILAGNPSPAPLAIWHGSNLEEPEIALDYMQMYGVLWHRESDTFDFVRWLFNHPKVLAERAAILECREALLWEQDSAARSALSSKDQQLTDGIDETLSVSIVTKRKDRRGKLVWPWVVG
jgi:tetratricopeptide (TPR) repeat protein